MSITYWLVSSKRKADCVAFHNFLKTEANAEPLEFLAAIAEYRALVAKKPVTLNLPLKFGKDQKPEEMAGFIFSKWLKDDKSKDAVNISGQERLALTKAVAGKVDGNTFNKVESSVSGELFLDSLPRFRKKIKNAPESKDVPAKLKDKKIAEAFYTFCKTRTSESCGAGKPLELLAALHLFKGEKVASSIAIDALAKLPFAAMMANKSLTPKDQANQLVSDYLSDKARKVWDFGDDTALHKAAKLLSASLLKKETVVGKDFFASLEKKEIMEDQIYKLLGKEMDYWVFNTDEGAAVYPLKY